ncbi:PREDICTED: zinc metalloproteinase nas-14-like [Branchiostoma belcheri]|uniref:Metalloendopeptidase n=1 Tax=Branchiostoma belcheri TaxID=7741 RepID=A0A6P5A4R6_BRABE|nr:PREDICTED: zinc metalloproteinase nas-14-like [Branchiostoma belcheri]
MKDPDENKTDVDLIITGNEDADEDLLEGDILDDTKSQFRTAVRSERKKWPKNADGIVVIPYVIISQQEFLERHVNQIEAVMEEFAARTCLHFVPRTDQRSYLRIKRARTCSTTVGRKGGPQTVNLNGVCAKRKGPIQHELMHTIGFLHEQSRADRDKHIKILWDNIKTGRKANFKAAGVKGYTLLGLPYDTRSVMHYGPKAFSTNRRLPTMVSKDPTKRIGGTRGWTNLDVLKVNTLYKCDATVTGKPIPKWHPHGDKQEQATQGTTELTPTHAGKQTTAREDGWPTNENPKSVTMPPSDTMPSVTMPTSDTMPSVTMPTSDTIPTSVTMPTSVTLSTVPLEMTTGETTTATRVRRTRVVCTFDEDLCGFTQGTRNDFNWSWSQEGKGTPSRRTGPKSDHTGHGRFLFIEATKKAPGKKARGFSPVYNTTGPHCLTFYYNMKGQGIGSLNVYLRMVGMATDDVRKLWSRSGPQGNRWSKAEVTFNTAANFQVIFEGVRGTSSRGDIAIDDMTLDTGSCA